MSEASTGRFPRRLLELGCDPLDSAVSRRMRLSNAVALLVSLLATIRMVVDLVLRRETPLVYVHGTLLLLCIAALGLARAERRLASRLVVIGAIFFAIAMMSHLMGRGAGSHYYCPALCALAWLLLPRRLWPIAVGVTVGTALLFANAELFLPRFGPYADPSLLGIARTVSLFASFGVLALTNWISTKETSEAQLELERMARTDTLTGINNRRALLEQGVSELKRARRYRRPLSVLLFDIDHFKAVNDTYGHHVGDVVIREVSDALTDELRHNDILGRVGGEELAAILPETDLAGAVICAERIRKRIEDMAIEVDGARVRVTISAGAAAAGNEDVVVEDVLRRADEGLYECKRGGRNRVKMVSCRHPLGARRKLGESKERASA